MNLFSPDETGTQSRRNRLSLKAAFMVVAVVSLICFLPALNNRLLDWDDAGFVTYNENIRSLSAATVSWAFTESYCSSWMPLTMLSFAVDYAFSGLNPSGYHLSNIVIHSCNAGLFFLLAFRLLLLRKNGTGPAYGSAERASTAADIYFAMLAAILFAIHPLRVESVVWVTERKDLLSMFFGLLAILAYARHACPPMSAASFAPSPRPFFFISSPAYWVMILCFTLSLLCKPMFVVLPLMLLVLDWYPFGRLGKHTVASLIAEKIPLLILSGLITFITLQVTVSLRNSYPAGDLSSRVLLAFKALFTYFRLFVLPVDISPVYLHPGVISIGPTIVSAIIIISAISCFCLLKVRSKPFLLAAWLLFLIPFLPVLNLSAIEFMAAHFTYLPALSFSFAVTAGIAALLQMQASSRPVVIFIKLATILICLGYGYITVRDTGFWKNDITLWSRVIELEPHRFGKAYFQRSLFFNLAGEYQRALADANEALAIAQQKNYAGTNELYGHRGAILKNMKNYDGALSDLTRAIETTDRMFNSKYYKERGEVYLLLGKSELAAEDFRMAEQPLGTN